MNDEPMKSLNRILTGDRDAVYQASLSMMEAADEPVEWSYDVWGDLVALTHTGNNHQRAIAA